MGKCKEKAQAILDAMYEEIGFMGSGRRNDDTVNLLIVCKILGKNPDVAANDIITFGSNYAAYAKHKERIEPYLKDWFSIDDETAMGYMLPGYRYLEL